jgi:hypothetical protein
MLADFKLVILFKILCREDRDKIRIKGRMGTILERLDEEATEADGHIGAGQPLRLELLQVVQQGL